MSTINRNLRQATASFISVFAESHKAHSEQDIKERANNHRLDVAERSMELASDYTAEQRTEAETLRKSLGLEF